jgi:outer membrane lipoprotein SlyB
MAEKKLIKGPDGKYYTPTAYKNQWGKQNVDISNMKITDVKKINSNPVKGKTRIGPLAGGGMGGMFGVKNR